MTAQEISTSIRDLIVEIGTDLDIDENKITTDAHFIKDMGFDSMALLEVLATMEKKFGVSIPETEFPNITTISKCTATVEKYLASKN